MQGRRGTCVRSLSAPGSGLPEGCSPGSPAAAGWIRDLHTGSVWSRQSRSCCRRLCKVTSDCFPFQRQPLRRRLSPVRTQGKWGMGGNSGAFVAGNGLLGPQSRSLCLLHPLTLQVFRGHRQDRSTRCARSASEPRRRGTRVCSSASASLGQGSPSGQARFGWRGQLHGAEAPG